MAANLSFSVHSNEMTYGGLYATERETTESCVCGSSCSAYVASSYLVKRYRIEKLSNLRRRKRERGGGDQQTSVAVIGRSAGFVVPAGGQDLPSQSDVASFGFLVVPSFFRSLLFSFLFNRI